MNYTRLLFPLIVSASALTGNSAADAAVPVIYSQEPAKPFGVTGINCSCELGDNYVPVGQDVLLSSFGWWGHNREAVSYRFVIREGDGSGGVGDQLFNQVFEIDGPDFQVTPLVALGSLRDFNEVSFPSSIALEADQEYWFSWQSLDSNDMPTTATWIMGALVDTFSRSHADLAEENFWDYSWQLNGILIPEPTTCILALAALCLAMSRSRSF